MPHTLGMFYLQFVHLMPLETHFSQADPGLKQRVFNICYKLRGKALLMLYLGDYDLSAMISQRLAKMFAFCGKHSEFWLGANLKYMLLYDPKIKCM